MQRSRSAAYAMTLMVGAGFLLPQPSAAVASVGVSTAGAEFQLEDTRFSVEKSSPRTVRGPRAKDPSAYMAPIDDRRVEAPLSDGPDLHQTYPNVAFGSDGTAYAVWQESAPPGGPPVITFARQGASGTWEATERVNDIDTGSSCNLSGHASPSMAVDASNNVYVVWHDCRSGGNLEDIYFSKRSAATGQWSPSVRVNDVVDKTQFQPSIAVAPNGTAVAVWFDERGGGSKRNIYSARLAPGASSWSANIKVTSNASSSKGAPDLAVGPSGTAYAVWNDARSGNMDVWFASLASGSSTWSSNVKISAVSSLCITLHYPDITVDGVGNLTALWHDCVENTAYATRRLIGSSTWTPSVELGSGLDIGGGIAARSDGLIHAAFTEYNGTRVFRALYTPESDTWSTAQVIAETSGGHWYSPTVGVDDSRAIVGYSAGSPLRLSWQPLGSVLPQSPPPPESEHNPPSSNQETGGDPVGTFTGAFSYSHTDSAIAGRGPAIEFARSYNSNDTRAASMGPGWTHTYEIRLTAPAIETPDVVLVGPQGRSDRYVRSGPTTFASPSGVFRSLEQNWDASFTAVDKSLTVWSFDPSGRLSRIEDRYGNRSNLVYDANGRLTSVSDPAGRGSLTLGYTGNLLTSVTDWASPVRTVTYQYDGSGRLWKVTDREIQTTTFGYDGASSRLASMTDARGNVALSLTYDALGRVATQKDARGAATGDVTTFSYVVNPDATRVTTVTYPVTSFEPSFHPTIQDTYAANGWITQRVSRPSSTETLTESYTYDSGGNRTSMTDARGNRTDFCYDVSYAGAGIPASAGNLTRTIAPAPETGSPRPVTLMKYDAQSNLVQTVAPKGVPSGTAVSCSTDLSAISTAYSTDHAYDATGALLLSTTIRSTDPDSGLRTSITKFEYGDAANPGLVTRIIPPRGNIGPTPDYSFATTFAHFVTGSQAGMLQAVSDPLGNTTTYSYDSVGRMTSSVGPRGNASGGVPAEHRTEFVYDNEDRVRSAKLPAPEPGGAQLATESRYDAVGNLAVRIDAAGQVTTYSYDERDALFEVKESGDPWTDPLSPPASIITTRYLHDGAGEMTRMIRAAGDGEQERVTDYSYDGRALVRTERQYPDWPSTSGALVTSTSYGPNGNRATVTDALGHTTTYGYNRLDRLTSIDYSSAGTADVAFTYDANGNRASMTDGNGSTTYAYDEADRLTSVTSPGPNTIGYRYDLEGNRSKLIYPDATSVTYVFDKAGRMESLTDWANRTTAYTYLADSELETVTYPNDTIATYTHDNARRITSITHSLGSTVLAEHVYGLDEVGNATSLVEGTNNWGYTHDALNRLTGVTGPDGARTYAYAAAGNRISKVSDSTTSYTYDRADRLQAAGSTPVVVDPNGNTTARGSDTFLHDQANRLTSATLGAQSETYSYDGDGVRFSRQVGTDPLIRYISDPNPQLPVIIADGTRKYVWGLGLVYAASGSGIEVFHTDRLGSIRALSDMSGAVTDQYRFDEFGIPTVSSGTSDQPFGFTGEPQDASGFVHLRARYFDPVLGRLASRDPIAGNPRACQTLNRYAYALNNPTTRTDPSGLKSQSLDDGSGDWTWPDLSWLVPCDPALAGIGLAQDALGALAVATGIVTVVETGGLGGPVGIAETSFGLYHIYEGQVKLYEAYHCE